jgi:hypothetical protein
MLDASVMHVFPFNHTITLRGRLSIITPSATAHEIAYALDYTIPIAFPFKRLTTAGQLRGSLTDEEGKGIADVLLTIGGEAALSDKLGAFYFASLKPGTVYLIIDKATLGFHNITSQPMPLEMLIRGGEESKIALVVTRSVTVAGTVTQFAETTQNILDSSRAVIEIGGRPGVFLELSSSKEFERRVSDNHGNFLFEDLRPGMWTLKVIGGDIPEYQIIVPDSIAVTLTPGERKDVIFQIRPGKRTIQMLPNGTVKQ